MINTFEKQPRSRVRGLRGLDGHCPLCSSFTLSTPADWDIYFNEISEVRLPGDIKERCSWSLNAFPHINNRIWSVTSTAEVKGTRKYLLQPSTCLGNQLTLWHYGFSAYNMMPLCKRELTGEEQQYKRSLSYEDPVPSQVVSVTAGWLDFFSG